MSKNDWLFNFMSNFQLLIGYQHSCQSTWWTKYL